jgi:hypothetical protein
MNIRSVMQAPEVYSEAKYSDIPLFVTLRAPDTTLRDTAAMDAQSVQRLTKDWVTGIRFLVVPFYILLHLDGCLDPRSLLSST